MDQSLGDGRYVILRTLGEGSQAATLEAKDARDGRVVAIKRFVVRNAKRWKDVELAEREARVLASLSHPMLPGYVEHFEEDGNLYLVMERIEGVSLLEVTKRGVRFDEEDVRRLLEEAHGALTYLHSRTPPIIHRDLKPGNVIRRPDKTFAFVDFGAVRDKLKPEGGSTIVGTFGYMAPEQFQGRAVPASDVYSIGATALWMLTGEQPEDLPHKGLGIDVTAAIGKRASPELVTVLRAMLEPDPDRRPRSIGPLLAGFEVRGKRIGGVAPRIESKAPPPPNPPAPAPPTTTTTTPAGPAEDVPQKVLATLRRFMPILWVMAGFSFMILGWQSAMGFLFGVIIISIAIRAYTPKTKAEKPRLSRVPKQGAKYLLRVEPSQEPSEPLRPAEEEKEERSSSSANR